mmetsp:Transcript_40245/g.129300  ORF Transcript_40245/g.129300 Transcript_40245/m.129300 type:complete len:216 (-) Transcript_40245:356-1003(-)
MLDDGGHLLEVFLQCGDQLVPARRPGRGRGIAARLGRLAAVAAAFTLGGAAVHVLLLRRRRGPVVGQPFDDEGLPREVSQQGRSGGHRPEAQTGDEGLQSVAQGQHNISLQELVRANLQPQTSGCRSRHTSRIFLRPSQLPEVFADRHAQWRGVSEQSLETIRKCRQAIQLPPRSMHHHGAGAPAPPSGKACKRERVSRAEPQLQHNSALQERAA